MSFHVVMFSFSPSPSLTVTTLIFRIAALIIPYDSDDYVIRIYIISLSPRHDDILNLYMFVLQFYSR